MTAPQPEGTEATKSPGIEYFPKSKPWRMADGALHLLGMRCPHCGAKAFPARSVCHACGRDDGMETVELVPTGTLYSFAEIHAAPKGFPTPYVIGFVDLDDGVRLLGQVEHRAAELGMDEKVQLVEGVIRTRGDGTKVVSYKFRRRSS